MLSNDKRKSREPGGISPDITKTPITSRASMVWSHNVLEDTANGLFRQSAFHVGACAIVPVIVLAGRDSRD